MCKVLQIGKSSYYDWKKKGSYKKGHEKPDDLKAIRQVYEKSKKTYGSPRITEELNAHGKEISKSTVARIMSKNGTTHAPFTPTVAKYKPGMRSNWLKETTSPMRIIFWSINCPVELNKR